MGPTRRIRSFSMFILGVGLLMNLVAPLGKGQNPAANAENAVAVVGGQLIDGAELNAAAAAQLRPLYNQEYQIEKDALEGLINQKLIKAEADRKGVPIDKFLEQEVDSKLGEPSEAELRAYYLGQKERLNRPYADVEPQLRASLKQSKIQQGRQDYIQKLREAAGVSILLRPPKVELSLDPGRLRGDPQAPVTIIEFSDYQCPYCQAVEATLKQVLGKYEGQVSLGYRDFPLYQIHPQAKLAAEASRCAADQGKFWEYHDLLFGNPSLLQEPALIEHARKLGLDESRFESCLSAGKFRPSVEADQQDGLKAGVTGTPSFFINGVFLSGNQPFAEFARIIEDELAAIRVKSQIAALLHGKEDARKKN